MIALPVNVIALLRAARYGPLSVRDFAPCAGSEHIARRTLAKLERDGYLIRAHVGRGRYWEITDAGREWIAGLHDVAARALRRECV